MASGSAFAAKWPKAIHEGNGTVCLFVDEKASPEQRDALLQIGSGQAGGLPFEILATTFDTLLPSRVSSRSNSRSMGCRAPPGSAMILRIALEPIKNPVTGDPEQVSGQSRHGFHLQDRRVRLRAGRLRSRSRR